MSKRLSILVCTIVAVLGMAGPVRAQSANLAIRIADPKTPTNLSDFPVTFVVLDLAGPRPITVTCEKKYETDGSFTAFGSAIAVSPDGNTASCQVTPSVFTRDGKYEIRATAVSGGESVSDTTSISYVSAGPGDPRDYSKDRIAECRYRIRFKTADDSGKTVRVEIYRSTDTTFAANDGTKVTGITIGSNQEYSYEDTVGDCSKTNYYAVRAFDAAGNGSGVVGDREVHVTTTTTTTTSTTTTAGTTANGAAPTGREGAIPVGGGSVLGEKTGEGSGSALGTASAVTNSVNEPVSGLSPTGKKKLIAAVIALAIIAVSVWLSMRKSRDDAR